MPKLPQKAYNLIFDSQVEPGKAACLPEFSPIQPEIETPQRKEDGWVGYMGPNISWKNWPRSRVTKLPMVHVITLRLPEEYNVKGEKYVGISFFQGDTVNADKHEISPLFFQRSEMDKDYLKYKPHPEYQELTTQIDDHFGVIWLTEEEFSPKEPAPNLIKPNDLNGDNEYEPHAWSYINSSETIPAYAKAWLVEREDPNVGKYPNEENQNGYISDLPEEQIEEFSMYSHLGGTLLPVQGLIHGLSPFCLEIESLPGMNIGDGNLQFDLLTNKTDWACT